MSRSTIMSSKQPTIKKSKKLFNRCKTIKDFLELWSKFYENEIYLPGYYGKFVSLEGDNPQATLDMGKKFEQITLKGVIPFDSQVTIPYIQKGYISALVNKEYMHQLCALLNRYNNIIAFSFNLNGDDDGADYLYVTYEQHPKETPVGKMVGKQRTQVGGADTSMMTFIHEWINEHLQSIINEYTYCQLTIINPSFESDPEYIIDVLLEAVNELFH